MPGQAVSYSSKVMTISNDGSGRPQVFEQSRHQRVYVIVEQVNMRYV